MAKKQTRRSVSLNRDAYVAASKEAFRRGMTLSQLTTEGYRALGIKLPETHHAPLEVAQKAADGKGELAMPGKLHVRLVGSFIKRPGPIRRALGDRVADSMGEPMWNDHLSPTLARVAGKGRAA